MKHTDDIHQLFEKKAFVYPDKIAIIDGEEKITYRELNRRSDAFAKRLMKLGIGEGDIVPIFAEKSINLIVSILGILKTKAAYLILHTKHPCSTRQAIVEAVQAKVACADTGHYELLPKNVDRIVNIDEVHPMMEGSFSPRKSNALPKDKKLAYILYTSGTTGHPKGVMVSHRNLTTIYNAWKESYELRESDIHLQMANPGFDVFAGDLLRSLLSGSTLVLCHEETLLDPEKLYQLILTNRISIAEFVPAVLRRLLKFLKQHQHRLDDFRLLICGSDQWTMGEYRFAQTFIPNHARLINSYGLTETTIDSTFFESVRTNNTLPDHAIVPIGKPFSNVELKCVREDGSLVAFGEVGELCIGGLAVSLGYFNELEMTQKFFTRSKSRRNKAKKTWFHTGDMVYYLPSGDIAMVGRNKNHIKIDGQRVDLLEIESYINQHPKISEAVVLPINSHALGCFIKLIPSVELSYPDLIDYLKEHLPAYSIPSDFYQVDEIALNANAKVIRQFEAQKTHMIRAIEPDYQRPQNTLEERLVVIWQEVLEKDFVSTNQHFKGDLNGKSLAFVAMIEKINQIFHLDLPHTLCDCTIQDLALKISEQSIYKQAYDQHRLSTPSENTSTRVFNPSNRFSLYHPSSNVRHYSRMLHPMPTITRYRGSLFYPMGARRIRETRLPIKGFSQCIRSLL